MPPQAPGEPTGMSATALPPIGAPAEQQHQQQQQQREQQQQQQRRRRLPVTLLSGFLGAGKTTLVQHLLRHAGGRRIAVVVNDVAALNIDSALIKGAGGGLVQSQEQLVELQDGCICCSLRVDLVAAVARLAAAGAFDLLLLEATGVSEPLQVAEIFAADVPIDGLLSSNGGSSDGGGNGASGGSVGAGGESAATEAAAAAVAAAAGGDGSAAAAVLLRDIAYLDTAVTVVDAHHMLANLHTIKTFREQQPADADTLPAAPQGPPADGAAAAAAAATPAAADAAAPAAAGGSSREASLAGSHRHIAELLLEQIEAADVLLLNKADTVDAAQLGLLQAMLRALNPGARLITTTHSVVEPQEVLLTGLWSPEKATSSAAWVQLLQQQHGAGAAGSSTGSTGSAVPQAPAGTLPQLTQQQQQQDQDQQQQHHHHAHSHAHSHVHSHEHGGAGCGSSGCTHCCDEPGQGAATPAAGAGAGAAASRALAPARPTTSYGVSHFVYRARQPFHPQRLHDFMVKFFVLQQPDWTRLMGQEEEQEEQEEQEDQQEQARRGTAAEASVPADAAAAAAAVSAAGAVPAAAAATAAAGGGSSGSEAPAPRPSSSTAQQQLQEVAAARRAALEASFGLLLRSKGFVWLATRGEHLGEWSQAGSLLSFSTGGPWFCVLPPEAWPSEDEARAAILADFAPVVGDRRQELVFIGVDLKERELRAALDACLVTVADMEAGFCSLAPLDPFEPWPPIEEIMDLEEPSDDEQQQQHQETQAGNEEEEEEDEGQGLSPTAMAAGPSSGSGGADVAGPAGADGGGADAAEAEELAWQPGQVVTLTQGAVQLQQLLEHIAEQQQQQAAGSTATPAAAAAAAAGAVVIDWVAPWAAASLAASQQLAALAAACRHLPVITVDVTASLENRILALEKAMEVPQVYRKGGRRFHPVPKSGEKWPCITLHLAQCMHPAQAFSGPQATAGLLAALQDLGCISQGAAAAATAAAAAAADGPSWAIASQAAQAAAAGVWQHGVRRPYVASSSSTDGATSADAAASGDGDGPGPETEGVGRGQHQTQQQQWGAATKLRLLKRGAPDLKQLLAEAAQPLLLVWGAASSSSSSSGSGGADEEGGGAGGADDGEGGGSSSSSDSIIGTMESVEALAAALAASCTSTSTSTRTSTSGSGTSSSSQGALVALADAAASKGNQSLAAALHVAPPMVQLFANRQVVKVVRVAGLQLAAAVAKVHKALVTHLQQQQQQGQSVGVAAPPTPPKQQQQVQHQQQPAAVQLQPPEGSSSSGAAAAATPADTTMQGASSSRTTTTASSSTSSIWDPPIGKAAKPGSKHKLPAAAVHGGSSNSSSSRGSRQGGGVTAVYWPRMPCLSCGCPWWLGEDWDATCARCGWSCEEGGYDDDSNPLPQHAGRYRAIVAALKEGRTPSGLDPLVEEEEEGQEA